MEFQKKKATGPCLLRAASRAREGVPVLFPGQAWKLWSPQHWVPRSHVPLKEAYFDELPEKCRFGVGGTQGKLR